MQLLKAADMGVEVDKETGAALVDGSGRREVRATTTTTTSNNGKNVDVEEPPKAYVPPPEDSDIEALVIAKKKRELLAKYQSTDLTDAEANAKSLLNKRE